MRTGQGSRPRNETAPATRWGGGGGRDRGVVGGARPEEAADLAVPG